MIVLTFNMSSMTGCVISLIFDSHMLICLESTSEAVVVVMSLSSEVCGCTMLRSKVYCRTRAPAAY